MGWFKSNAVSQVIGAVSVFAVSGNPSWMLPAVFAGGITAIFFNHKFKKKFEKFDRETAAKTYKLLSDKKIRTKIDREWMLHYEDRSAINATHFRLGFSAIGFSLLVLIGAVTFDFNFIQTAFVGIVGYIFGIGFGHMLAEKFGYIDRELGKM